MKKLVVMLMMFVCCVDVTLPSDHSSNASEVSSQAEDKFYDALWDGKIAFAEMLLDLDPELKSEVNFDDQTFLHLAVQNNFPARSVAFLIKKGWDLSAQDAWGKTPWMYALSEPFIPEIIDMFFNSGKPINFLLEDKNKQTFYDYARKYNQRWADSFVDYIEYLQNKKGAEVFAEYAETLKDPLKNDSVKQELEKIEANYVASSRKNNFLIRSEENPSILIRQMPKQELESELNGVDWDLDKKSDFQVLQLGRLEDKEKKLQIIGQLFEHGAGI